MKDNVLLVNVNQSPNHDVKTLHKFSYQTKKKKHTHTQLMRNILKKKHN